MPCSGSGRAVADRGRTARGRAPCRRRRSARSARRNRSCRRRATPRAAGSRAARPVSSRRRSLDLARAAQVVDRAPQVRLALLVVAPPGKRLRFEARPDARCSCARHAADAASRCIMLKRRAGNPASTTRRQNPSTSSSSDTPRRPCSTSHSANPARSRGAAARGAITVRCRRTCGSTPSRRPAPARRTAPARAPRRTAA